MNKIEKFIYDLIKNHPSLKIAIRNIYQLVFDLIPDKRNFFKNTPICKEGYFFGFHDISPFSIYSDKILANKLAIPLRMPLKSDLLKVGYFTDYTLKNYISLDETTAWNYHKGCRLQWVGNTDEIIFNIMDNNRPKAKIINSEAVLSKVVNWPIDTISSDGKMATSFSYQRLNRFMPGYGYECEDDAFLDKASPVKTGLFIIDIKNNTRELLISLKEISEMKSNKSMWEATHYITHTLFSPDNQYVAFLHRWTKKDIKKVWTRLCTFDLKNKQIYFSPTNGMVSHFVWKKHSNELIAYCKIKDVDSHILFSKPDLSEYKKVGFPTINSDGHQSSIDDNSFVTDTYPDRRRYASLYKVNIDNNNVEKLAELKSFRKFQSPNYHTHWACDLHPRVNNNGKVVSFDSVHTKKRAFCIMSIE